LSTESPAAAQAIEEALTAAAAALERGDGPAAEQAVTAAARACEALAAAGASPDGPALETLRALHARLVERATGARDELAAELDRAGRSRRAISAYRVG
jgi:hypothetical protein